MSENTKIELPPYERIKVGEIIDDYTGYPVKSTGLSLEEDNSPKSFFKTIKRLFRSDNSKTSTSDAPKELTSKP